MKTSARRKILLTLFSIFAAMMAAGGVSDNETKISAVSNSAISNANRNIARPANDSPAPKLVPPSATVQARASKINLQTGKTAEAEIKVIVAGGDHINGNPASSVRGCEPQN